MKQNLVTKLGLYTANFAAFLKNLFSNQPFPKKYTMGRTNFGKLSQTKMKTFN